MRTVLVTSRSFEEYVAFFALSPDDLRREILDCGGGASGFAAQSGAAVTVVDPLLADPVALQEAAEAGTADGAAIIERHGDRFVWDWYGAPERRRQLRDAARAAFLLDLTAHPERYVAGSLPHLPFADRSFDLALCSHLLFTWSDVFDEAWHEAALRELARVAGEVRVFPLVVQGTGDPVGFLPGLLDRLRADGWRADVLRVPYRFQRAGDEMLLLRAPAPTRPGDRRRIVARGEGLDAVP